MFWFKPTSYGPFPDLIFPKQTTINDNTRQVTKSLAELARKMTAPLRSWGSRHLAANFRLIIVLLYFGSINGILSVGGVFTYLTPKVSAQVKTSLFRTRSSQSPFAASVTHPGQIAFLPTRYRTLSSPERRPLYSPHTALYPYSR